MGGLCLMVDNKEDDSLKQGQNDKQGNVISSEKG